jgi:hypothetical protein
MALLVQFLLFTLAFFILISEVCSEARLKLTYIRVLEMSALYAISCTALLNILFSAALWIVAMAGAFLTIASAGALIKLLLNKLGRL